MAQRLALLFAYLWVTNETNDALSVAFDQSVDSLESLALNLSDLLTNAIIHHSISQT